MLAQSVMLPAPVPAASSRLAGSVDLGVLTTEITPDLVDEVKITATWPWAQEITTAWQRIQAIPHPTRPAQARPAELRKETGGPWNPGQPGPPAGPPSRPDPKIQVQKPGSPHASGSHQAP
jgi:hypothetical protein